ncbi:MAG: nickel pincer cofactor biosynthesis protein LarC, partial [Bryobacteraceae bacterium]
DAATLIATLDSLATGAAFRVERTKRKGIAAAKFHVDAPQAQAKHRHLHHISAMIDASSLTPGAKKRAHNIFAKLAEAEASVHGTSIEKVHFHEVGAVDSIADVCGAAQALDMLGIDRLVCSPVNTGSGTVHTEHGLLPVPAPATARLLEGVPVYARGPALELTTPTGAAIAATLASGFGALPTMRITATGYGAGDRDFAEHANVLRVILGDSVQAAESTTVSVIEANIDDSTPEVLGHAMTVLAEMGALDVTLSAVSMKKNRPGVVLGVIARPDDREALVAALFAETSTFGVRIHEAERRVQPRQLVPVDTPYGPIRVKVAGNGSFAPEFEDCRAAAEAAGIPLRTVMSAAAGAWASRLKTSVG